MARRTLLLNSWFFPIKVLRWEDAVKMKYEETVDIIAEYDEEIRSPSVVWKTPAVIRLRRQIKSTKRGVKFSRVNVYARDKFRCQYCGNKFAIEELSYDHVLPRSAGGKTVWENIVTACKTCNSKKDNMTCDEAGMFPLTKPHRPKSLPLTPPLVNIKTAPEEWHPYLVNA
jgi:5-methylcytosine-specific restriction endonuclease McrA